MEKNKVVKNFRMLKMFGHNTKILTKQFQIKYSQKQDTGFLLKQFALYTCRQIRLQQVEGDVRSDSVKVQPDKQCRKSHSFMERRTEIQSEEHQQLLQKSA